MCWNWCCGWERLNFKSLPGSDAAVSGLSIAHIGLENEEEPLMFRVRGAGGIGQRSLLPPTLHRCPFSRRDKLAELHGNMFVEECVKCGKYVGLSLSLGGAGSGAGALLLSPGDAGGRYKPSLFAADLWVRAAVSLGRGAGRWMKD